METYEQKLKLAKEALESGSYDKETIEYIFPELKESEDERIRKALISYLRVMRNSGGVASFNGFSIKEYITYLEKQGNLMKALQISNARIGELIEENYYLKEQLEKQDEQKSKDKSELKEESEDERIRKELIEYLESDRDCQPCQDVSFYDRSIAWLEKQKEQKPAEWSEEDREMRMKILKYLSTRCNVNEYEEVENWLNSLRPQPKNEWSEEDSRILYNVIAYIGYAAGQRGVRDDEFKEANSWLKSLPERFVLQPKQE